VAILNETLKTVSATPRTALDIETANPQVQLQEVTPKCIGTVLP
jgi:hypothetical protein